MGNQQCNMSNVVPQLQVDILMKDENAKKQIKAEGKGHHNWLIIVFETSYIEDDTLITILLFWSKICDAPIMFWIKNKQ